MDARTSLPQIRIGDALPPSATERAAASRKTAEEYESFFLSSIMETLFSGVGTESFFGGGQTENVYRSMLLQEYGKTATRAGGIGIAAAVQREMLRMQEAAA
jgi:flagellar protein FlgJ